MEIPRGIGGGRERVLRGKKGGWGEWREWEKAKKSGESEKTSTSTQWGRGWGEGTPLTRARNVRLERTNTRLMPICTMFRIV